MKNIIILLMFYIGFQSTNAQKKITVYWDASFSMKERKMDKELQYLNNYFKEEQTVNVTLVVFSNDIILREEFIIEAGNWADLKQELQNTIYDGATSFSNLFKESDDECLVFTDGIENIDKFKPPIDKPIHIISTLDNTNSINLKLYADLSSGAYIYLAHDFEKPSVKGKAEQIDIEIDKGFVTGTVNGVEGVLSNVSIINKSSNQGVTSLKDGTYKIKADKDDVLAFSYLGKKTINIRVSKENVVHISMPNVDENLDEVVIIAEVEKEELIDTGNLKVNKKKIGYHVETITDKDISAIDTDIEKAVAGRFSNFDLKSDQLITEFISRGRNTTILGDQRGLVVVDGVPMARGSVAASLSGSSSLLNPENILSITLLKGLAATNKWGSEGRNGVLLITTKNAVGGKVTAKKKVKLGTTATYIGNAQLISQLPEVPYIKVLKTSKTIDQAFKNYLLQREKYGNKPEFYFDTFEYFKGWNNQLLSKRVLSNVYEIAFNDAKALRALSYHQQANRNYKDAVITLKRVLKLKPKQSQSYRDLALVNNYAKNYKESLKIYDNIDKNRGVGNIVLLGMNKTITNETKNLIALHRNQLNIQGINQKFLRPLKYKARVIFEWNNFDAEFNLNIINPQKRFFTWSHTVADNSQRILQEKELGYGLEEFYLTSSDLGEWTFNMTYFGNNSKLDEPTFIKITIYKNFGSDDETKDIKVVRLHKKNIEQTVVKLNLN